MIRLSFKLRDINIVVFPDWTLPAEQVAAQLRELLNAMVEHPEGPRLTLVVAVGSEPERSARLVETIYLEVLRPGGVSIAGPSVTAVADVFNAPDEDVLLSQREILLHCCQWRVNLPGEDAAAVASSGARNSPAFRSRRFEPNDRWRGNQRRGFFDVSRIFHQPRP